MRSARESGAGSLLGLVVQPKVAVGLAAILFLFAGQFALFTYVRPFLEMVTRVDVSTLSLILLLMGVTGIVGTMLIGNLLRRWAHEVLIVAPLLMAGIAIALMAFGGWIVATALLLGAWGFIGTPAPVGWATWLSRTLPADAEAGGGLMVATIQFAITLGATVGGLLFDLQGYRATFAVSALLLVMAAVMACLASRTGRAQPTPAPAP